MYLLGDTGGHATVVTYQVTSLPKVSDVAHKKRRSPVEESTWEKAKLVAENYLQLYKNHILIN